MGSGLLNLMQNGLGNTLGLALMTTVLQRRLTYHSSILDQQQTLGALTLGEVLAPVQELVQRAGAVGSLGETQAWRCCNAIWNSKRLWRLIKIALCWLLSWVSPACRWYSCCGVPGRENNVRSATPLCECRLCLRQPEGHPHGMVQVDSSG